MFVYTLYLDTADGHLASKPGDLMSRQYAGNLIQPALFQESSTLLLKHSHQNGWLATLQAYCNSELCLRLAFSSTFPTTFYYYWHQFYSVVKMSLGMSAALSRCQGLAGSPRVEQYTTQNHPSIRRSAQESVREPFSPISLWCLRRTYKGKSFRQRQRSLGAEWVSWSREFGT